MSSTRPTSAHRAIKVEETSHDEHTSISMLPDQFPTRKRACSRSIASAPATAMPTSSAGVKEEEMPASLNSSGARAPTQVEYERLQQLLEESYLFREQVVEENQRLLARLHITRCELFKLRSFVDFAANKIHQQAGRRFRGIDSDSEDEDDLEDSKSIHEDMEDSKPVYEHM
ncbi:hypothetical protein MSAN_02513300 [Mycena sanguinolenta]|uniref:Uncharacterized protein n=1 Tax=Mycena sanguinolenta TaxID=230812 RepID=A0A8H6TZ06_9AGAR|nr:hypothetical protein MSAN_02513300 [Mycena sanguinolenta]